MDIPKILTELSFKKAIDFFKSKLKLPTQKWTDITDAAQKYAFTVAGVEKAKVLDITYKLIEDALTGKAGVDTFGNFAQKFNETMVTNGYGEQKPWRTALVYRQNVSQAYQSGRWKQMRSPEMLRTNPYYQWFHDHPITPRDYHKALHLKVYRANDPIWGIIGHPPYGFGCRCKLFALAESDLKRDDLTVSDWDEMTTAKDLQTGKTYQVPAVNGKAITDPGFLMPEDTSKDGVLKTAIARLHPSIRALIQFLNN